MKDLFLTPLCNCHRGSYNCKCWLAAENGANLQVQYSSDVMSPTAWTSSKWFTKRHVSHPGELKLHAGGRTSNTHYKYSYHKNIKLIYFIHNLNWLLVLFSFLLKKVNCGFSVKKLNCAFEMCISACFMLIHLTVFIWGKNPSILY